MRKRMNSKHDRKVFRNTAVASKKINVLPVSYRGGIRF